MENLEHLSDAIGPRRDGLAAIEAGQRVDGGDVSQVRLDERAPGAVDDRAFVDARNRARANRSPTEHPLTIAAAGWSPSTAGVVRGPVVYFDAKKKEEFEKFRGKLKGAVVIYQEPESLSPPKPEDSRSEVVRADAGAAADEGRTAGATPFAALQQAARDRTAFFKQEGVAVLLRDSNKPHALLNMTGIGGEKFDIGAIPTAFITGEGYRHDFSDAETRAGERRNRNDQFVQRQTGGSLQHGGGNSRQREAG